MPKHVPVQALDRAAAPAAWRTITYTPLLAAVLLFAVVAVIAVLPFSYQSAVSLGLVHGLAEFLPISSSAHLILTPWFLGWPDLDPTFDTALHLGTLVAVAAYFRHDWITLLRAAPHPRTPDGQLFWLLMLGAIPGSIAAVVLENPAEVAQHSPLLIAGALALIGLALLVADRFGRNDRRLHDIGFVDALLIGGAQVLAIIPGVSRSGITIAVARARGIERATAARFTFLLSCPVILGATLLKLPDLADIPDALDGPFFAGVATAVVVGAFSVGFVLRYLHQAGLGIFVAYRLLLAALVVVTLFFGLR